MELPWKEIRLVALDLDGTTLRPDGTLSDRAQRALKSCLDAGIEIVIASGRAYSTLPDEVLAVKGIRYAITSNGAAVNEVPCGKRIWAKCLDAKAAGWILEAVRGERVAIETFIDGIAYAACDYVADPVKWGCPSSAVGYVQGTRKPVQNIEAFLLENGGQLDSIDLICGDMLLKRRLEEKILAGMPDIYATASVPHLLELSAAGGKGAGLRKVCEITGVLPRETAACGNADNDADMLLFSGIGAAVADATPACLEASSLVIGTNREDGAAEFLEKIVRSSSAGAGLLRK